VCCLRWRKKDGNEVLGLKVSSPSSGGAWPFYGWCSSSFVKVVRPEACHHVKFLILLVEMRDLDILLVVRPAASKEVRLALDCSVMEKEPLGKNLLLKP
jgi:hypothetical protein